MNSYLSPVMILSLSSSFSSSQHFINVSISFFTLSGTLNFSDIFSSLSKSFTAIYLGLTSLCCISLSTIDSICFNVFSAFSIGSLKFCFFLDKAQCLASSISSLIPSPFSADVSTTGHPSISESLFLFIVVPFFLITSIIFSAITVGTPSSST